MAAFEEMNGTQLESNPQAFQLYETLRRQFDSVFEEMKTAQYMREKEAQESKEENDYRQKYEELREALREVLLENEIYKEKLKGEKNPLFKSHLQNARQNSPLMSIQNETQQIDQEEKQEYLDGRHNDEDKFLTFEKHENLHQKVTQTYHFEIDNKILTDYIDQLFQNKKLFDQACEESGLAYLTLE